MSPNRITLTCQFCGEPFEVQPYRQDSARYCSKTCLARGRQPNRTYPPAEERFWANVEKTEGCWLWTAALDTKGYGQFRVDDRLTLAHRFSWELHHGAIPEGLCVLHNCPGGDNPACVNPAHLWLGTKVDNNRDRHEKGRTVIPNNKGRRRRGPSRA